MSRIVAGSARGRRLLMPHGRDTRPTADRVREALFTSLEAAVGPLGGLAVLDLYAGSGAIAAEALSRGARPVWLVERGRQAATAARRNLEALGELRVNATLRVQSVRTVLAEPAPQPFDIVFLDPPYATTVAALDDVLDLAAEHGWVSDDSILVVERASRDGFRWPHGFAAEKDRRYGDTTLFYGRPQPPDQPRDQEGDT